MRDPSIDALRFIGLVMIIIAHVEAPFTIIQIRTCDVPLMVFISGLCFSGKNINNIKHFYWERSKRLLIPVWSFIPIYLAPLLLAQFLGIMRCGLTLPNVLGCFIFLGEGMGYIWIFKVFLFIMFFTPFLIQITRRVQNVYLFFFIIIFIIAIQTLLVKMQCFWGGWLIYKSYILYMIAYTPCFMLGLKARESSTNGEKKLLLMMSVLVIIALFGYLHYESMPIVVNEFKTPPQHYYLIYGLGASMILWYLRPQIGIIGKYKLVKYVSKNSDWLYLWHTPMVIPISYITNDWMIRFISCSLFAFLAVFIQKKIVASINNPFVSKYF